MHLGLPQPEGHSMAIAVPMTKCSERVNAELSGSTRFAIRHHAQRL